MIRLALITMIVGTTTSYAAVTPEQACQAGRAKAAGKYTQCIQGEVSKFYSGGGDPAKLGKCVTKYAITYDKLRAKALTSPAAETCDAARYVDNGNGTVTDNLGALLWEKKTTDATVHDEGNVYTWSAVPAGTVADGTAFTAS